MKRLYMYIYIYTPYIYGVEIDGEEEEITIADTPLCPLDTSAVFIEKCFINEEF